MRVSLALHVIGIVFWIGGLTFLTLAIRSGGAAPAAAAKLWRIFVLPGLCLALLTGLYQLHAMNWAHFKMGWFHGKLTIVLFMLAVTWLASKEVRKLTSGAEPSRGKLIFCHAASASSLILAVFLTILGR